MDNEYYEELKKEYFSVKDKVLNLQPKVECATRGFSRVSNNGKLAAWELLEQRYHFLQSYLKMLSKQITYIEENKNGVQRG